MWQNDHEPEDPTLRQSPPPFQFNFQVFCPWATQIEVLVHKNANLHASAVLFPLTRTEGALWCGEMDLPGRDHAFLYRCISPTRSIVAAFDTGYPPPEIYAKLTARATYPGRPSNPTACS